MVRTIARKDYENGRFGTQSAALSYDDGLTADGYRLSKPYWVVSSWDHWAHDTLGDAKAHYRRIG